MVTAQISVFYGHFRSLPCFKDPLSFIMTIIECVFISIDKVSIFSAIHSVYMIISSSQQLIIFVILVFLRIIKNFVCI